MPTDEQILNGELVNSPKGRFGTPRARCEALYLNEGGWLSCVNSHWHDAEAGEACMDCGSPMRAERLPDRGSVFAGVYERWKAAKQN